jgi:penicillin-binding protein activator
MKITLKCLCWTVLLALLATGCATTIEYGDATSSKPINTGFGSSDLQQIAAKMVDSLLEDDLIADISTDGPPLLVVDKVKNKTM